MVVVPARVLDRYEAFTCFNSPYVAHDAGRAIDLYPGHDRAISPVAGEVVAVERVRAPPKPYAPDHDHLVVIDTAGAAPGFETPAGPATARLLHLDSAVAVGDRVAVGDDLGQLIRAGFFAPWVDRHLHLGFREPGTNPRRARGSLPVTLRIEPVGIDWDGTGRVVRTGETYVELEAPPGLAGVDPATWVGLTTREGWILDGGLAHYPCGGRLESLLEGAPSPPDGPVGFLDASVGVARGRRVEWGSVRVTVDGDPVTGLSLFCARAGRFRPKIVHPNHDVEPGDHLRVAIEVDPTA